MIVKTRVMSSSSGARTTGPKPGGHQREVILDGAARVFMDLGYAAASIDAISAEVGATKGYVYYHFRSKAELFFAVHRHAVEELAAVLRAAGDAGGPPAAKIHRMVFDHTQLVMTKLPYMRVAALGLEMHLTSRATVSERSELAEVVALRDAAEQFYLDVVEEGVASGDFRPINTRLVVKPLLGAVNWTSRWYRPRVHQNAAEREAVAREIADFVTNGLLKAR
jgi:AcrR family transcriptional regulator